MDMVGQADITQSAKGPFAAFRGGDSRQGECQFHIRQDGLVGNEVVALEDEADAVIAVGVPVAVAVARGRYAVDDQVAGVESIQASDDVEHRGFSRTGGTENCDEFTGAEAEGNPVERRLSEGCGDIRLPDFPQFKHLPSLAHFEVYYFPSIPFPAASFAPIYLAPTTAQWTHSEGCFLSHKRVQFLKHTFVSGLTQRQS